MTTAAACDAACAEKGAGCWRAAYYDGSGGSSPSDGSGGGGGGDCKLKVGGLLAGDDYNLDPSGIETIEMMDGGAKGAAGAGAGIGAGAAGSSPALAPTKFGVKRAFDDFFRARQRENKWLEGGFALGSWAYPQGLHQGRFSCNFGLHKV